MHVAASSGPSSTHGEGPVKLLFFDDFKLGVLKGDAVFDVSSLVEGVPHTGPHDLISGLIAGFGGYRARLEEAATKSGGVPLSRVRIRPPLPRPANIVCMAVNYMEDGTRTEPAPINAFLKSPGAVIGPGDTMALPDVPATIFEGEAEVALVVGKRASRVNADEVPDPLNLQVRLWVNGELKQNFNTNDMAHKIARCIEWVTSIHTLEPGDVLATGTNHRGLSAFQDGDQIELETDGLGRLRFSVRDDLKRTWARETRLERQEKKQEGTTPQLTGKHAPAS